MEDANMHLECPFCLEYFRHPVMLQCSHNLCRECAMKILGFESLITDTLPPSGKDGRPQPGAAQPDGLEHKDKKSNEVLGVRCPECRQVTPEAKLLPNRALEASIEKAAPGGTPICDFCDTVATRHCTTCTVSYCKQHLPNHPKRLNGMHTLVEASKIKELKSVASAAECTTHKQKFQLWCRSHEVLVCLICAQYGQHKECKCETIETVADDTCGLVQQQLNKLRTVQTEAAGFQKELGKAMAEIKESTGKQSKRSRPSLRNEASSWPRSRRTSCRLWTACRQSAWRYAAAQGKNPERDLFLVSQCNSYLASLQDAAVCIPPTNLQFKSVAETESSMLGKIESQEDKQNIQLQLPNMGQVDVAVLQEWVGHRELKLLYQASVDGWSSAIFHQKCDNQGPTVTLVRNNTGFVFGGYAALSWNQNEAYIADNANRSFLFSLSDGKGRAPFKCPLEKNQQNALYGMQGCGPTFGAGHDLCLILDGYNQ
eukprot:g9875.t1